MEKSFNLVSDPWLKVIDTNNQEKLVSLTEVFTNASSYRQLAGDMPSQDVSILRLLLAILTTVYMRVDADGEQYEDIDFDDGKWHLDDDEIDNYKDDLLSTWKRLYQQKTFSSALIDYLDKYQEKFNLFGESPFYQVNKTVYDQNVEASKKVEKGKGTVAIKQMNRLISESNNTPALFSPKSTGHKNELDLATLARWLITYQTFATGTTDKTKIKAKDKFSESAGWVYGLNVVFIKGKNLFDTLMLNLDFDIKHLTKPLQKPVWEYSDINEYLKLRKNAISPKSIPELYTLWSRMLHIEWDENDVPTIFSAGLPKIDNADAFYEPMTSWHFVKDHFKPATRTRNNMNVAMWRNFGQYVKLHGKDDKKNRQPGIVEWVDEIKNYLPKDQVINLMSVNLVSDGNATSQAPYAELVDNMEIHANVLFDENSTAWPARIEDVIELTQTIGKDFWIFANALAKLNSSPDKEFANKIASHFYSQLNEPFNNWLTSIKADDDIPEKQHEWKIILQRIVYKQSQTVFSSVTSTAIRGNKDNNIFTIFNKFNRNVYKHLNLKKGN